MSNSENEDDPAIYESSGSDWTNSMKLATERRSKRTSARSSKKAKSKSQSSTSDSEIEEHKPRKKSGMNKRQKVNSKLSGISNRCNLSKTINSKDFTTGSFLILKKDANVGDVNKSPCIWRIDGKALLQKYEPYDDKGKIRYRTTSIYTGWSSLDKDLYAPISVTVTYGRKNRLHIVDLNWEKLKEINMDSE